MTALLQRTNRATQSAEHWRPPAFTPNVTAWHARLARLRRFFDLQAGTIWNDLEAALAGVRGTLLDVGCGAQPYRPLVPAGVRYTGIDTVDAKRHFGYELPGVTYFPGDTWPVADAFADAVLCTETLEHVQDPRAFLLEAHRCLRPGGRLIMTVPFAARWHFIPHDYYRYTPSALHHLLTGAGFANVAVYARGNPLTVACYKFMALLLPFVIPDGGGLAVRVARRAAGLPCVPLLIALATVGNVSQLFDWGDDWLGFTVIADRAGPGPATGPDAVSPSAFLANTAAKAEHGVPK